MFSQLMSATFNSVAAKVNETVQFAEGVGQIVNSFNTVGMMQGQVV